MIRRKLFDYIRDADEKKVKAIYTMVETDIHEDNDVWDDEFTREMERRKREFENGTDKGVPWEEVQERAMKQLKAARKK